MAENMADQIVRATLENVCSVVEALMEDGISVVVAGGWAEELRGLTPPRAHGDIDLVAMDVEIDRLDRFVATEDEVPAKRFPHKRAFLRDGVMVEILIAAKVDNRFITNFWGCEPFVWPSDLSGEQIDGLPVAGSSALSGYRAGYGKAWTLWPGLDSTLKVLNYPLSEVISSKSKKD